MGTHLRVPSESYPMNTNMTGLRGNSKIFASYALDDSSLAIERVNLRINNSKSFANIHTDDNEHNRITGRIAKSWGTVSISLICHTQFLILNISI